MKQKGGNCMIPSEHQQAIYDCWEQENTNILVNAVAGSGKTTTVLELLKRCEYRTLFLAFNSSVQKEIQTRIEAEGLVQGKALTIHSLGFSAIRKKFKCKVEKGKNWKLWKTIQKNNKSVFDKTTFKESYRIGYTLMEMNNVSRLFLSDEVEELYKLMDSMDKFYDPHPLIPTLWREFLEIRKESYTKGFIYIDFIDMIYLPVHFDLFIPMQPYYLMIDEAQDLNACQHRLIDKLINQGVHKWIAVGDRNQAIYGFSGASSESFDLFLEKGEVKELPLGVCYRCDTAIVEAANEVYDVMTPFKESFGVVKETTYIQGIQENAMVVCRNSGPLIKLFFQLISLGKPAYIKGDDIIGIINKFLTPYSKDSIRFALETIEKKLAEMKEQEETSYRYFILKENYDNFKLMALHLCDFNGTVGGLLTQIKRIFESKRGAITLCTIHKAKGLEADVVYILNEDLIPSKFATSEPQLRQEQNLKYVARTRAKKEMYYLTI